MIYNNRFYPHPVLGMHEDYKSSSINVELSFRADVDVVELRPIFSITDRILKGLITKGDAYYVLHLYCRGTMYREAFYSPSNKYDPICIPSTKLNGEVEVDFFVCANNKIEDYTNPDFNDDYRQGKFSLERSEIIAYGGKGRFFANKSPEELKAISSLMCIECSGESYKPMKLDFTGNRIAVKLCKEDYANYKVLRRDVNSYGLILNNIVLPALIESLYYIEQDEADEFVDQSWYKNLKERKESFSGTILEVAQKILELPINRALHSLLNEYDDNVSN